MSIKIPKDLFKLPFFMKLCTWAFGSIGISLIFIGLAILKGAKISSQQNLRQNYTSHITIYPKNYNLNSPKEIASWWKDPLPKLDSLKTEPFIRSITTRSVFSAYHYTNNQSTPFFLTVLDNEDSAVFNNFIFPDENQMDIPQNYIYIGYDLAEKLKVKINDFFPIIIPNNEIEIPDLKIGHIFNSPDRSLNHLRGYISRKTIDKFINNIFETYHVRLNASPFIPIIISNINTNFINYKYSQPEQHLSYQFDMLNILEHNMISWGYYIYIILGLIIFLFHFLRKYILINDFNKITYRMGIVQAISPHKKIFMNCLAFIIKINMTAFFLLGLFLFFTPPISSSIFTSENGAFREYSLLLPYYFHAKFSLKNTFLLLFNGTIIFGLTIWVMIFIQYILTLFLDPKNRASYITIGLIIITIAGFSSSYHYFYQCFANKGRNKYWINYFSGKYSLYEKNYLSNKSMKLPPIYFRLNDSLIQHLQQTDTPYLATLETVGEALVQTNYLSPGIAPLYKKKMIYIKSIFGEKHQEFEDIINKIAQNQVIIGKDIADFVGNNSLVNLQIQTPYGKKMTTSIAFQHTINFETDELNNTLFMNHQALAETLSIFPHNITKLQIKGSNKKIEHYTTKHIVKKSAKENNQYWNILSKLILRSILIKNTLKIVAVFTILLNIFIYLILLDKENLLFHYLWGLRYEPFNAYILMCFYSFFIGILSSWILNLRHIFSKQLLPKFLQIKEFTPIMLPFDICYTPLFFLLLISFIIYVFVIISTNYIIKKMQIYILSYKNSQRD